MKATMEDWKNGWFGLRIGLSPQEIDTLIDNLSMLKTDPDQHFHMSSNYKGKGGVGDIEISRKEADEADNMSIGGKALTPGSEI